ncbi:16S rRNA (cytosine(967)-C(5))-methyltransferase RsmB [Francisella tularensis]|uniref:16S rRNA (cytosine(967)-C(5))-methyltransferase RsmB n=1 Tax=Francisella tularensis TaxID=263 RepID=UPI000173E2BB|nr:16S rRNA (cytosine(967)-C(5))-methyltransferase RsmB [Francisella tularensis]ACD30626.1 tRNA and rRNA cytosine-C5-methylase, sun protein [Francisella tularensis subsp. mediasiatica FSC147]MBK2077795.1 16S rRNA (cytosine(967)-C(5))-methyltransferase RsmB [Francisella tularensis subsp. mediasiatica]MBK2101406.1 16S rRNA (cytosine(967)-C(5))-methyltransferase RsmB [Francisella tularensis subsp. mediasiatica]MBK2104907.1 16S rRNA (cytosine(967)-C(5))-methyltransferase RsmB [Francisella tularensi
MNTRAIAAKTILDILDNKYSLLTIEQKLVKLNLLEQDKSFIKLLCYEFFRHYYSLEKIIALYLTQKTKVKAKVLIMLGALQIFEIKQPYYATINETVAACKVLKIIWAKKLVNRILREMTRNIEDITSIYTQNKAIDMPEWLCDTLKKQYPNDHLVIAQAINAKADMFIRLNQNKDNKKVLDYFDKNNIGYSFTNLKDCIKLDQAIDVKYNQPFQQGYFTIQDISAQYAGHIIKAANNDKILDACAAPGGKTSHILECAPQADITAIDIIDKRLELLRENLERLSENHNVNVFKHDLTLPLAGKFNKIILDAPCSALGTIRRNPDIKVLRTPNDIQAIKSLQSKILANLWNNNLTDNGYLLYITCSILAEENQQQIKEFLAKNNNAEIIEIDILEKYKTSYGYQLLPSQQDGDGFYYCLLKKNPYF